MVESVAEQDDPLGETLEAEDEELTAGALFFPDAVPGGEDDAEPGA